MFNDLKTEERRDFLKKSLSIAGVAICATSLASLVEACSSSNGPTNIGTGDVTLDINTVADLTVPGGSTRHAAWTGQFSDKPVIIIRVDQTNFVAFSSVCTHQSYTVSPPADSTSDMVCHNHNSHFSRVDGHVVSGPAPSSLIKFNTTFDSATNMLRIWH